MVFLWWLTFPQQFELESPIFPYPKYAYIVKHLFQHKIYYY